MYTELIDGSIQSRNQNARIVHLEDIGYESCDHERYTSLFQYGESIRKQRQSLWTFEKVEWQDNLCIYVAMVI